MYLKYDNSIMNKVYYRKAIILLILPSMALSSPDFEFTTDQACGTKRLDLPPEVLSTIPVQDQDGTNLCSAYASAQLIDAWRIANNPPVDALTSPIAFGVQYAAVTNQSGINFNPVLEVIGYAKKLDTCSYNVIRDEFNSKKSADFIYELVKNYQDAKNDSSQFEKSAKSILNCVLASGTSNTIDIEKIKKYMNEKTWVQYSNKIIEEICSNHKKSLSFLPGVTELKAHTYKNKTSAMNSFKKNINNRLDQKNAQPIGISYCKKVLKDKESNGVSPAGLLNNSTCNNQVHASVIVGRRLLKYKYGNKIETICQFLVRDSFGSSCNGYDLYEPDSIPMNTGEDRPKICENGQVWVDENSLMMNTSEVFHLKDK